MLDPSLKPLTPRNNVDVNSISPPTIEIKDEEKLTNLANEVLKDVKNADKVNRLRQFTQHKKFSNKNIIKILTHHGFNVQQAKTIIINLWMHGDRLTKEEAESMLKQAPNNTWILRKSGNQHIITKKHGEDNYEHITFYNTEDAERIINGYSMKYPIKDMLLTSNMLKKVYLNYGKSTAADAKQILSNAPEGSWILRSNETKQAHYICIKIPPDKKGNTVKEYAVGSDFQTKGKFSLNDRIQMLEQVVNKEYKKNMKLQAYGIGSNQKQIERTVQYLMHKKFQRVGKEEFKQDFTKLSRKKERVYLPSSYLVKNIGQKKDDRGQPVFDPASLSFQDIKLYRCVHQAEGLWKKGGILGEGGVKIAKVVIEDETGELLVKSKYKNLTAQQLSMQYPELNMIFDTLKDTPYVATGRIVLFEDKKGCRIPSIIIEYAVTDLKKHVDKAGLDNQMKIQFARHLLTGLAGTHEKGVAHRDLKPENINIYEDPVTHELIAKIVDWDFATKQSSFSFRGSPIYSAPEFVEKEQNKSLEQLQIGDVFSMGMTLYYLFNGKHLWFDYNKPDKDQIGQLVTFVNLTPAQFESLFPEPTKDTIDHLIWEMIHMDSRKRPTARAALEAVVRFGVA